jgi:hypothetical protein
VPPPLTIEPVNRGDSENGRLRRSAVGAGLGGVAGLVSGAVFLREAVLVLAVGVVALALIALGGALLILGKVIFHGDDGPYRKLRGLLREARGTADPPPEAPS